MTNRHEHVNSREEYVRRLGQQWKDDQPDERYEHDADDDGDPRAAYVRRITANDSCLHPSYRRAAKSGHVIAFHDVVNVPTGTTQTDLPIGTVLRMQREQRQRDRTQGGV